LDDHCDCCHHVSHVEEPDWWLWRISQRHQVLCCRCLHNATYNGCNGLYFQFAGTCPNCDQHAWNTDPTHVWAPCDNVPFDEQAGRSGGVPPGGGGCATPLEGLLDKERRERLEHWLESLTDDGHRMIVRGLLVEGRPLADLANSLGLPFSGREFQQLARSALGQVPAELCPRFDGTGNTGFLR
jgi:hypothetical protein